MIANLRGALECPGAWNNKFLTSDLDTLFCDAYRRLALVSFSRIKEKRLAGERKKNRTRANQQELMETSFSVSVLLLSFSFAFTHVLSSHRPIRKGFEAPVRLESPARRKATSGSQDEARENRETVN